MLLASRWSRFRRNVCTQSWPLPSWWTSFKAALSATADWSSLSTTSCAVAGMSMDNKAKKSMVKCFIIVLLNRKRRWASLSFFIYRFVGGFPFASFFTALPFFRGCPFASSLVVLSFFRGCPFASSFVALSFFRGCSLASFLSLHRSSEVFFCLFFCRFTVLQRLLSVPLFLFISFMNASLLSGNRVSQSLLPV